MGCQQTISTETLKMAEEGLARGESDQDEQIAQAINDRLVDDGQVCGTDIQVHVTASEVTLTGDVDSQNARSRAEEIAGAVPGVSYVINNLRVAQECTTGATG